MSRVVKLGPPFGPGLLDILDTKIVEWSGEVWRIVLEGSDPLVANSRGARWNSPEFEAVYFSLDPKAAHAELDYLLGRQPIPIRKARLVYRFDVSLVRVLDLRSGHGLEEYGLDTNALVEESWTHTQALGHAAYIYLECAGILVPSARHDAANLVLFLGGMASGDALSPPTTAPSLPTRMD